MSQKKSIYGIRLRDVVNLSVIDWFSDITILEQGDGETLLVGEFSDQSALCGLLDKLWNLNYTILTIEQIETHEETGT